MSLPQRRRGLRLRYATLPSRLARFLSTAFPNPREKVKQIRLRGRPLFSTKSVAPRLPASPLETYRLPLLKTSLISFLLFRRSSRLNRKETFVSDLIGLFLVGNCQLIPAFSPAALEYQPSAFCFHSGTEPEFTVPLNFTGLISPFHGIFSYPLYIKVLENTVSS